MRKSIALLITLLSLLLSCTNDAIDPSSITSVGSWEKTFLKYWNVMNTEYVHFSEDPIDWDSIYDTYLPLFKALDWDNEDDSIMAFKYFKEIAINLKDNHYNLTVADGHGNTLSFSPAFERKWSEASSESYLDYYDIIKSDNSLISVNNREPKTKDTRYSEVVSVLPEINEIATLTTVNAFHSYTFKTDTIIDINPKESLDDGDPNYETFLSNTGLDTLHYFFGITDDNIAYLYLSDFTPSDLFNVSKYGNSNYKYYNELSISDKLKIKELQENTAKLFGYDTNGNIISSGTNLINYYVHNSNIKGFIIDIRSNGGGELSFLNRLMGNFFSEQTAFGYVRYKNGYNRGEYTPFVPFYISAADENSSDTEDYQKPIAIIVNGMSASCSEMTCMIAKQLPKHAIIGSTTYGGTCALSSRDLFHSGPYKSGNISIYTTTFQFRGIDWQNYETIGIAPDYPITYSSDEDNRFNKAIDWINYK